MTAINIPKAQPIEGVQQPLPRGAPWTDAEIEWIKNNYDKYQIKQMPAFLPTRTAEAIRQKGIQLGMKKKRPLVSFPIAEIDGFMLGYFVGLLEGEGTITVEPVKYRLMSCGASVTQYTPVVLISNTNYELLENLRKGLASGAVRKVTRQIGRKQSFVFRIRGRKPCYSVLKQILPYLVVKKPVCMAVLRYLETRDPAIVNEIRALNRRVSVESLSTCYSIFASSSIDANITNADT
jgi:hypothetical protein